MAEELLSRGCAFAVVGAMMKGLWLVGRHVVDGLHLRFLVFIAAGYLLERGSNVSHDSVDKRMVRHLPDRHSLVLVADKTLSYEILQVFRQRFQQINIILVDFLNELSLVAAGPWCFSMQYLIQNDSN